MGSLPHCRAIFGRCSGSGIPACCVRASAWEMEWKWSRNSYLRWTVRLPLISKAVIFRNGPVVAWTLRYVVWRIKRKSYPEPAPTGLLTTESRLQTLQLFMRFTEKWSLFPRQNRNVKASQTVPSLVITVVVEVCMLPPSVRSYFHSVNYSTFTQSYSQRFVSYIHGPSPSYIHGPELHRDRTVEGSPGDRRAVPVTSRKCTAEAELSREQIPVQLAIIWPWRHALFSTTSTIHFTAQTRTPHQFFFLSPCSLPWWCTWWPCCFPSPPWCA